MVLLSNLVCRLLFLMGFGKTLGNTALMDSSLGVPSPAFGFPMIRLHFYSPADLSVRVVC